MTTPRPIALIVLDGFGHRTAIEANAIAQAKTPVWDNLWHSCPHTTLSASHQAVGLPEGQMGNSEVGHLTMGAGRVIYQDLTRVSNEIESGDFYKNLVLITALDTIKRRGTTLHVLGLLSPGGVHSHEDHIFALLKFAKTYGLQKIVVHPFLDGRDTPPKSAKDSLQSLEKLCQGSEDALPYLKIGSISGRYYAMDRDKRYERTESVYEMLTENKANFHAESAISALQAAYERNENDEFVKPTLIGKTSPIQDGDSVLFMNFRSDRARQLSYAFTDPNFSGFERKVIPKLASFITLSEYAKDIAAEVLYPPASLDNMFGAILEQHHLRQLRIAETEKYAHVTFFFNGGREIPFKGEDRILVPSPNVATYDLCPEMSAFEVTDKLVQAIHSNQYDVIICNFANADMVGHTGHFDVTRKAIEVLDLCLGKIVAALKAVGGEAIITADHGNAEYMFDENTHQPHTAHTDELVPFVFVGRPAKINPVIATVENNDKKQAHNEHNEHNEHNHNLISNTPVTASGTKPETTQRTTPGTMPVTGTLADIAPTLLTLLNLKIPKEMTGQTVIIPC